jgi:UDP-N-acetylglucosamine--N-acetylmuramyl-(pentapeptide) pyrophosphoryl-undecaprenol N-acetylglucosamine transferase
MRLLVAGGGTGGHLYPGMAVAEEVKARGGEVLFVGTSRGLEARVVPAAGYPLELLAVSGLKRVGAGGFVRGVGRLPVAFARSMGIVRRFRPDVVLGVGGYASGPLVMAAALMRRPTAIQEQNSVPGVTNRILGRFVRAVFTAFDEAKASFPARKVVMTGNPVRRAFLAAAEAASSRAAAPTAGGGRLLVVGGSQGARAINDLVLGAIPIWRAAGRLPAIVHQSGAADADRLSAEYAKLGVGDRVTVRPFIEDMAAAYAAADVVLGRAGALTLAELAMAGRPALLVPLPTAADDHQTKNAQAFVSAGAAVSWGQATTTAQTVAEGVTALLADADRRRAMGAAMRALARPDAARAVVDRLEALAGASRPPAAG